MIDRIEINLPIKVVSESNNFDHWTKKRKRKLDMAFLIKSSFRTIKPISDQQIAEIKLTRISPRNLDEDNLVTAFKGARDCVADLLIPGLAPGRADGDKRLKWQYAQKKGEVRENFLKIELKII